jgi:hypothetical protein
MRFHLGAIPESPDFRPDDSWKPLRELTPLMAQLIALPLGFVVCVAIGAAWVLFTPLGRFPFDFPGLFLIAFLVLIPVHEFIHFAVHPKSNNSEQSVLGFVAVTWIVLRPLSWRAFPKQTCRHSDYAPACSLVWAFICLRNCSLFLQLFGNCLDAERALLLCGRLGDYSFADPSPTQRRCP